MFKEYFKNLPFLRLPKDSSSSKGKEQEEALEGEDQVSTVQQIGDDESDAQEEDVDDAPLVRFAIQKRKVKLMIQ